MTTEAKTVEQLEAELAEAVTKYENLNRAHDKLKTDFKELKTHAADADSLQKQIETLQSEKEQLSTQFESFKGEVKQEKVKQLLTSKLEEAGAKSTATAMKLIDMNAITFDEKGELAEDSVNTAIESLKAEHSIIFADASAPANKPTAPAVKHAVDTVTKSAFEAEMAEAVKSGSQKQLEEVFAKYKGTKR